MVKPQANLVAGRPNAHRMESRTLGPNAPVGLLLPDGEEEDLLVRLDSYNHLDPTRANHAHLHAHRDSCVGAAWLQLGGAVFTCCARRASRCDFWVGSFGLVWTVLLRVASSAMPCNDFWYFGHLITDFCDLALAWARHWQGEGLVERYHDDLGVVSVVVTTSS